MIITINACARKPCSEEVFSDTFLLAGPRVSPSAERGAYTGAHNPRAGRFERASGGTLFLDEAGDLPLATQVKLLRALQTSEIERLGAESLTRVDVHIVAATHVDLQRAMSQGKFRSDQVLPAQYPSHHDSAVAPAHRGPPS